MNSPDLYKQEHHSNRTCGPTLTDLLQAANHTAPSGTMHTLPAASPQQLIQESARQHTPTSLCSSPSLATSLPTPAKRSGPSFPSKTIDEIIAHENELRAQQAAREKARLEELVRLEIEGPTRPWAGGKRRRYTNPTPEQRAWRKQQELEKKKRKYRNRCKAWTYEEREERRQIRRERARLKRKTETPEEAEDRREYNRVRMAGVRRRERERKVLKDFCHRLRRQQHNIRCLAVKRASNTVDSSALRLDGSAAHEEVNNTIEALMQWAASGLQVPEELAPAQPLSQIAMSEQTALESACVMSPLPGDPIDVASTLLLPSKSMPDTALLDHEAALGGDEEIGSLFGDRSSRDEVSSLFGGASGSGESETTAGQHAGASRGLASVSDLQAGAASLLLPTNGTASVVTAEELRRAANKFNKVQSAADAAADAAAQAAAEATAQAQRQQGIEDTVDSLLKAAANAAEEDSRILEDPGQPLVDKLNLVVKAIAEADEAPPTTASDDPQSYLAGVTEINTALAAVEVLDGAIARGDTVPINLDVLEDVVLKIEALVVMTTLLGKDTTKESGTGPAAAATEAAAVKAVVAAAASQPAQLPNLQHIRKRPSSNMRVVQHDGMASPLSVSSQCPLTPRPGSVVSVGALSDSPWSRGIAVPRSRQTGAVPSQNIEAIMFSPLMPSKELCVLPFDQQFVHCVPSHPASIAVRALTAPNRGFVMPPQKHVVPSQQYGMPPRAYTVPEHPYGVPLPAFYTQLPHHQGSQRVPSAQLRMQVHFRGSSAYAARGRVIVKELERSSKERLAKEAEAKAAEKAAKAEVYAKIAAAQLRRSRARASESAAQQPSSQVTAGVDMPRTCVPSVASVAQVGGTHS